MSVGNDTYNPTKYDEIQLIDVTESRYPKKGDSFLSKWRIKNSNKNNGCNLGIFLNTTLTSSPTPQSGATSLVPFGTAIMYKKTSSHKHDNNVFVSWERTDIIQISIIKF